MKWVSLSRSFAIFALAIFLVMPLGARSQQPPVKFKLKASYDSGGVAAQSVALSDVNGDGHLDVIVANGCPGIACTSSAGTVGVLLGNGDGTFQTRVTYASGGNDATSVAVGDFNGDGKADVVVANHCAIGKDCNTDDTGEVSVLLGNGDGTFQPAVIYGSGGFAPTAVAIADVNRDGKADLLVVNDCSSLECADVHGVVGVLLGNGDGTFLPAVGYDTGSGHAASIAVADLNGDGNVDLAIANRCLNDEPGSCNAGLGVIGVLLGNGDGTFRFPATYLPGGWSASAVTIQDMNGDGHPDLVVTDDRTGLYGHVSIMFNDGSGKFQAGALHTVGRQAFSLAVGDVNGDGFPDIAAVSPCANDLCDHGKISFLPGVAGGVTSGAASVSPSGGYIPYAAAIGDVNGDGRPDVVVANSCADFHICTGTGVVGVLLNSLVLATTTTAVTSSNNPAHVHQPVTLTATVSSSRPVPDGRVVMFSVGTTTIGSGTTTNGVATLTTSFSKANTYTVKAVYAGFDFLGPSSGTVKQVVNP